MHNAVEFFGKLLLVAFQRAYQQIVDTFVAALVLVDMREIDVDAYTEVVHCLYIRLKLDYGFAERVRALVDVIAVLDSSVQVIPVAIHQ